MTCPRSPATRCRRPTRTCSTTSAGTSPTSTPAAKLCASWSGSLYELSWYLRGRERILYDYYDHPALVDLLVERIAAFVGELTERNLAAGVDVLSFYDDLGTQSSLFISPEIFRRFYKPHYRRIWGRAKALNPDALIFLHACGNVAAIIPDLIECGLDILNPVQPEAMDPDWVSREYGRDLALWGTMSVQRTFPFGGREDIFREVREQGGEHRLPRGADPRPGEHAGAGHPAGQPGPLRGRLPGVLPEVRGHALRLLGAFRRRGVPAPNAAGSFGRTPESRQGLI